MCAHLQRWLEQKVDQAAVGLYCPLDAPRPPSVNLTLRAVRTFATARFDLMVRAFASLQRSLLHVKRILLTQRRGE